MPALGEKSEDRSLPTILDEETACIDVLLDQKKNPKASKAHLGACVCESFPNRLLPFYA